MFAKYKLKFLEDPKKVFGESEHVDSVINPGLETKAPDGGRIPEEVPVETG